MKKQSKLRWTKIKNEKQRTLKNYTIGLFNNGSGHSFSKKEYETRSSICQRPKRKFTIKKTQLKTCIIFI